MRMEHWIYALPLRLRSLFRRKRVDQELDEELEYHLERKIEENIARGKTAEEARYEAMRAMDGLTQQKEECREARRVNFLDNTAQDIRYSLRVLRKSPGFTTIAVLTLALAIGANAVVFAVLNTMILRPLQVAEPESFYAVEHGNDKSTSWSYPDYLDLRDRNRSFEGLTAFNTLQGGLDTGDSLSRVWGHEVTGNYFDVLGIQPYLGRFFHASEARGANSAPYIVLTYAYWQSRFQGDRGAVGRTVRLNKLPFTIIGVAPPGFHGTVLFMSIDIFVVKENWAQTASLNARGIATFEMVMGHLKAGVTPQQAIADLNSIGAYLEKTYPKTDSNMRFVLARPSLYGDAAGPGVQAFLTALMLLAALILLAACANLGSLFAARAADRSREVALRLALGGSRTRILRTLFTEALIISLAGGAIGLWGSAVLLSGLSVWQPIPRYPLQVAVNPDAHVYGIALLLTLASGFLFAAVPSRQVLQTDPYQIVKSGSRATGGRRITLRDLVLAVQIAICAVLVTASMVALRGMMRSLHTNFGFDPRNAMLMDTDLNMAGYHGDAVPAMQKRMFDAIRSVPGVSAVGLIDTIPLGADANDSPIFSGETTDLRPANAVAGAMYYRISPEYFRAAGTTLLAGRDFTWHDDRNAPSVAVVNRSFAIKMFGSPAGAIGRYYKLLDGLRIQVVGVVEDGKYGTLIESPQLAAFVPILQSPTSGTTMVARSKLDPRQLAVTMRSKMHDLDAGLPAYIQTWSAELELALFASRMATISLGVLGAMGAMLSITGIFGMAAYSVSKRLKELGIRMALGAQRREILQAALGRALKLLVFGSAAGLILGILASQVLASIVYQATSRDPLVLAGVVLAMALLGLLATCIPAQRALWLDPSTLLREE